MAHWKLGLVLILILVCQWNQVGYSQTAQLGADLKVRGNLPVLIEKIIYKPARWESEKVKEYESEIVNKGGLVHVYYRNVSDKPIGIKYWRWNRKDRSHWALNHFIAWDRYVNQTIQPNQLGVLEINATSEEYGEGKKFFLQFVDDNSRLCSSVEGVLVESPIRITYIRVLPGMKNLLIFVKNLSNAEIIMGNVHIESYSVSSARWNKSKISKGDLAIASVELSNPLPLGSWFIVGVEIKDTKGDLVDRVYAHRRAFEDEFPIGVWTNSPETYDTLYNLHIDTMVEGGSKDNPFFTKVAPEYGFRAMVITGAPPNVEVVKEFSGHPNVICWMIQDEPDWSTPANLTYFAYEQLVRYDTTKPTFITLCRNIKFFEYASICDIPCQDHYSVTAPSSSIWPKPYGTRLEETAYYTRDLKLASEPKPIWVWSQAIAKWTERPKRPVPTPEELSAQLVLNLGRGAKGILWFNHDKKVAQKYPELEKEMQGWGRVMCLLREFFLSSDPINFNGNVDEKVDVAPLEGFNFMLLCITNLDYEIHPEAYPFKYKDNLSITLNTDQPFKNAIEITPSGLMNLSISNLRKGVKFELPKLTSATIVLLHSEDVKDSLAKDWDKIVSKEKEHLYPVNISK